MKLYSYFVRDTRDNGDTFTKLVDDAPEWLVEAVREAHDDTLPNDWVYETCANACAEIDDGRLTDDTVGEFADGEVDSYTQSLFRWAAEFCLSDLYSEAEERAEEFGGDASQSVCDRLGVIQYCAIERIATTILAAVPSEREADDENE